MNLSHSLPSLSCNHAIHVQICKELRRIEPVWGIGWHFLKWPRRGKDLIWPLEFAMLQGTGLRETWELRSPQQCYGKWEKFYVNYERIITSFRFNKTTKKHGKFSTKGFGSVTENLLQMSKQSDYRTFHFVSFAKWFSLLTSISKSPDHKEVMILHSVCYKWL